jgi:hypothetical protein
MHEWELAMFIMNILLVLLFVGAFIVPPIGIGIGTTYIISKFFEIHLIVKLIICFAVSVAMFFIWQPAGKLIVGWFFA